MKYFVDEEDVQNLGTPLFGVRDKTSLFDSFDEADRVADEMSKGGIPYQVWSVSDTGAVEMVLTPP